MASKGSFLSSGQSLNVGDYLTSRTGQFTVVLKDNGNLKMFPGTDPNYAGAALWESGGGPLGDYIAVMRVDGNLVVCRGTDPNCTGGAFWESGTAGPPTGNYMAILQDDGRFAVYQGSDPNNPGQQIWGARLWIPLANHPTPPFYPDTMLLLTDGTVLCQNSRTPYWWRLRPDMFGSYINGTWSQLPPTQPISFDPQVRLSRSPALIPYRFGQQDLLFSVHEGQGESGELWYTTFDGTTWALDEPIPNVGTTGGPGLAVFHDRLYCAHQGHGASGELWYTAFDGTGWAQDQQISNVGMSGSPALIPYSFGQQDLLFCVHEGKGNSGQLWYTTFDGTTWAPDQQIPNVGTTGGPGLAVFHNRLYCVHQGHGASGELWYTTFNGLNWSQDRFIANVGVSGSPALIVYQNQLYCVHEGKGNSGQLWYTVFDRISSTWAPDQQIPNVRTTGGPGLAVFNLGGKDLLCCAHQGYGANGELWYTTFDGTGWSPDQLVGPDNHTPYAPIFYASAVLADGRVFVAGGEYLQIHGVRSQGVDALAAQIYDPTTNEWTNIPTPPGWKVIGDAPCCILPDGRLLLGAIDTRATAIYDPAKKTWTAGPDKEAVQSAEETWTLLPDNTVLTVECFNPPSCEKYVVAEIQWVSAGQTPVAIVDTAANEIGPAILLPDGRVFVIGATGRTALYTMPAKATDPGTWKVGPNFPFEGYNLLGAKDAPACLLPNGNVLCTVGPVDPQLPPDVFKGPTKFFTYDPKQPTQTVTPVLPPPSNISTSDGSGSRVDLPPHTGRLLLLPTGQVLFANTEVPNDIEVLTPNGTYDTAWQPTIINCPTTLSTGQTRTLRGTQLNGLSQACSYGDDASMATNYPLVRIRNLTDNTIGYCRTSNHSTMGVATGTTLQSTQFSVRPGIEFGPAELTVIANGIPSAPWPVTIV